MLVKSLRANPSILLFLLFCALFGYHLGTGSGSSLPLPPPPPPPAPEPAGEGPPPPPPPPPEPRAPRIAVVTFITDQKSYIHLSLKNKDHYARRHGYDLVVDYEAHTDRGTTYWKFDMMQRLIKTGKWDWLWWMDFDTLVTNTDIKVADIIDEALKNATDPDNLDFLTTHDCNGLNTGSFIVRGHERSLDFLKNIYTIHEKGKASDNNLSEQDAMAKLIETDSEKGDRTMQVPQWRLNAFPEEIACFDESRQVWKHGTFVIHFAGAWAHVKGDDPTGQLMKKYESEIIWGDWNEFY